MSPQAFRITELRLQHFKAFDRAALAVDPLTVLVGRNGAGKSSLMDAFALMREALRDSLDNALERRGGAASVRHQRSRQDEVALALTMTNGHHEALYGFRFGATKAGHMAVVEEHLTVRPTSPRVKQEADSFKRQGTALESSYFKGLPKLPKESLLLPLVAGLRPEWQSVAQSITQCATHHLSPQAMRQASDIGDREHLTPDGRNFGDVLKALQHHPDRFKSVESYLSAITPGIESLSVSALHGKRLVRFFQQMGAKDMAIFEQHQVSDGTLRALGLLLALFQDPQPSLCFLDEIEDTLHPHAIEVLMEAIHEASSQSDPPMPVVITTHHPDLLSNPLVTGDSLRIVQWEEGVSRIHRPSANTLGLLQPPEDVGRLLRANALWPADEPELPPEDFFGFR